MTLELHVSDAVSFRECRRRWYFGSKTQRNLEPKTPKTALWLGTGIHLGLEAYGGSRARGADHAAAATNMVKSFKDWAHIEFLKIDDAVLGIMPDHMVELRDAEALGVGMLEHYADWVEEEDEKAGLWYQDVEVKFEVPLGEDIVLAGRMDGLVRVEGALWVGENKTTISNKQSFLMLDEQAGAYLIGARELFAEEIAGVHYTFLRKKLPRLPEPLKSNKGLSQNMSIDTTYELYLGSIMENGFDIRDYSGILEALKAKGNTFFRSQLVERSVRETNELKNRLLAVGLDMRDAIENRRLYPSPGISGFSRCQMCSFTPVCLAIAEEADWEHILSERYTTRPEDRLEIAWEEE